MGIFNNINKDTLNGLSLTKLNNDNIRISPGQISLGSTIMTLNESVDLALSGNLMNGESENASKYYYLYAYNGKKPDVDEYTKLLIHSDDVESDPISFVDSSESGHVITRNGDVKHSVNEKKFGESAIYFDGDGDYLTIPDSDDWSFGYNDFTIDFWVYLLEATPTYRRKPIIATSTAIDNNACFALFQTDDSKWQITKKTVNYEWPDSAASTINTWFHLAITRIGNIITLYRDGISLGTWDFGHNDINYPALYVANYTTNGYYFYGYIDELRISKGIARWTENFTPDTSPYTPDANTKLLIHSNLKTDNLFLDSSESGHTITKNGDTFHSVSEKKFGQSSMYFDGVGDYLTIPDSEDWNLISDTTTSYTIDFWVKFSSAPSSDQMFVGYVQDTGNYWLFYYFGDDNCIHLRSRRSHTLIYAENSIAITDTDWHHIALVKEGGTGHIYVDGIGGSEITFSDTATFSAVLGIGNTTYTAWNQYFNGYLDELRISKGIARWTENFTPDASIYTSDEYTKLLIHSDISLFNDSSIFKHPIIRKGNTHHKVAEKKFGSSAMYFDGVGDYLSIPDSEDFKFSTNPFTIDFWIHPTILSTWRRIFSTSDSAHTGWNVYFTDSGVIGWSVGDGSSWVAQLETDGTENLIVNQWNHVAFVREGTGVDEFTIYIKGIATGSTTYSGSQGDSGNKFYIGQLSYTGTDYNGYLDEFRISKGIARWTENFTPDTSPYIIEDPPENNLKFKYSAVKPTKDQYSNTVTNYNSRRNSSLIHPTRSDMKYIGNILNNSNGNIERVSREFSSFIMNATGGIITYDGDYRIHTFLEDGEFIVTVSGGEIEYLVVAGGGAGGNNYSGGGGAGGYLTGTVFSVFNQVYNIIVGTGGVANSGSNSKFTNSIVAIGGGVGGGNDYTGGNGCDGGSGGGARGVRIGPYLGGVGSQGRNGGGAGGENRNETGAGGGGAGEDGAYGVSGNAGGNGGNGISNSITGLSVTYAGGGGGGGWYNSGGAGGAGGGGAGGSGNGIDGLGGGGGGAINYNNGGNGGSGIVILRYKYQ